MRVIKKNEVRKLKYGCVVVAKNFLLDYSLFKITVNHSKKVEFSLEKQKDMSDDGTLIMAVVMCVQYLCILYGWCAAANAHKGLEKNQFPRLPFSSSKTHRII